MGPKKTDGRTDGGGRAGRTVVVGNVGVDVVADERLYDVVAVHLARVAERRSSGVVASVHVSAPRQQQPYGQHPGLLLLHHAHAQTSTSLTHFQRRLAIRGYDQPVYQF